jgi:hypothetical protein
MQISSEPRIFDPAHAPAALVLLTVLVLGGCERPKEVPVDASRVALAANEHLKAFGDYTLHVNALTTDQLPPEVAKEYRIQRSTARAMLNVVVTTKSDNGDKPVTANVVANARNLAGQFKDLEMREIREKDAIYYIADLPVDNQETLIFNIDVLPVNETEVLRLSYRHEFFH